MVKRWKFLVVLAWAVIATVFLVWRNPLPVPDRGHRCFAVINQRAVEAVAYITTHVGGIGEKFTFRAGSTQQTLLWDNTTVIILLDRGARGKLPANALSLPVGNPKESAAKAADILRARGFTVTVDTSVDPGGKLVILSSNAFQGWSLVFRKHILAMGGMPKMWKITK